MRLVAGFVVASITLCGTIVVACVGDADPNPSGCDVGTVGCPCTSGGACNPTLTCASNTCVDLNADGSTPGDGATQLNDAGTSNDGATSEGGNVVMSNSCTAPTRV